MDITKVELKNIVINEYNDKVEVFGIIKVEDLFINFNEESTYDWKDMSEFEKGESDIISVKVTEEGLKSVNNLDGVTRPTGLYLPSKEFTVVNGFSKLKNLKLTDSIMIKLLVDELDADIFERLYEQTVESVRLSMSKVPNVYEKYSELGRIQEEVYNWLQTTGDGAYKLKIVESGAMFVENLPKVQGTKVQVVTKKEFYRLLANMVSFTIEDVPFGIEKDLYTIALDVKLRLEKVLMETPVQDIVKELQKFY